LPAVGKLYVVRHADAGHRSDWSGPDHKRPLSARGERQADGIRNELADSGVVRLVSSPYTRCVQTLEPLAKELGLTVEADERLAEGARTRDVLALVDELQGAPAAVCSHGDVIPDLLEALLRDGLKLRDELRWQKASTWVLTRDGGRLTKGRYVPPPA
jgi:8-oxo-dGTP diphosphatase